jgi:hypothetical protein
LSQQNQHTKECSPLNPKLTYTNKKNDSRIPYQRIFTRNIKKLQEISFKNFDKQILISTFFQFLPLNKRVTKVTNKLFSITH